MISERITEKAIAYINNLFRDNAGGHDVEHTLRVYRNALLIMQNEADCDREIVELSALLHDADDPKLFDTGNNENARRFFSENGIREDRAEKICEVINSVSFSRNRDRIPDSIEAKIVQDADRLDAMGAIGIARTFAYGGEHGRPLGESVRHLYDKLLLLRERMNTETGRQLAAGRHAFLETFLREYVGETEAAAFGPSDLTVIRADQTWQQAGAYYVRIQAMAKKHHITLRQEFDEHDTPETKYIVVTDKDFPVATARIYPEGEGGMMIGRVVVLPEYRHRGIGTMVVRECEKWAAELGCVKTVLESRENKVDFYLGMGYVVCGGPVDGETFRCVRMEKVLNGDRHRYNIVTVP